jgi:MFS transporter, DHA2 family, multidrug resistance protein
VLAQVASAGLAALVCGWSIVYLGLGSVYTLGTDLVVGAAPPERAGAAAALSETSTELGGALGIALLGSFGTATYRAAMSAADLDRVPPAARRAAEETLGGAVVAARALSEPAATRLLGAAQSAFIETMAQSAAICALLSAALAVLAVLVLRRARALDDAARTPEPCAAQR